MQFTCDEDIVDHGEHHMQISDVASKIAHFSDVYLLAERNWEKKKLNKKIGGSTKTHSGQLPHAKLFWHRSRRLRLPTINQLTNNAFKHKKPQMQEAIVFVA